MTSETAGLAIHSVWWRQLPHGRDPLARPEPARDARWQRGDVVDGLYLADSPETAWAEWYRWLADYGLAPKTGLPRDLWRVEVALERVADLRTSAALARLGLGAPRPSRADWPPFQVVGERLAADHPAVLAPSAARPEGQVLCVFRRGDELGGVTAVGAPERVDDPPAPPGGLRT